MPWKDLLGGCEYLASHVPLLDKTTLGGRGQGREGGGRGREGGMEGEGGRMGEREGGGGGGGGGGGVEEGRE